MKFLFKKNIINKRKEKHVLFVFSRKNINNFYKKCSECRHCNRARGLKRYYENKDKIYNQQKIYYGINREKILLQKKNTRSIQIKDLVTTFVELENKLKALEEKVKTE